MRQWISGWAGLVVSLLLVPAAGAQPSAGAAESEFARPGLYLWLGGATGIDMAAEDAANSAAASLGLPPGARVQVQNAIGFDGRVGARTGRSLAVELQLEYLPSFDWDVSVGGPSVTAVEMRVLTMTGNLKAYLLQGRIQPFALIGGGGLFAEASSPLVSGSESASSFAFRGGGGIDVYLTQHFALSGDVSYVLPNGDNEDLDYLSIGWGLQYNF